MHIAFINLFLKRWSMLVSFKRLQQFRSPDGGGFSAILCIDGQEAADLHDAGHGGGIAWTWLKDSEAAEAKWADYVASLAPVPARGGGTYMRREDEVLEEFLNEWGLRRHYVKWCGGSGGCTVYRHEGMKKGAWTQVHVPFSPESKARILAECAGKTVTFANELPMSMTMRVHDGLEPSAALDPEETASRVQIVGTAVATKTASKGVGIGDFCKALIRKGWTNPEIMGAVRREFPTAKTSLASLASYRSAVKKEG